MKNETVIHHHPMGGAHYGAPHGPNLNTPGTNLPPPYMGYATVPRAQASAQVAPVPPYPGIQYGEHAVNGSTKLLNEKVALDSHMKYDGNQISKGANWRSVTRNYLITKAPDAEAILDLVESNEDVPAWWINVSQALAGDQGRTQQIASELWGHLNLCLSGAARRIFANVPIQEGLEAWRRLMKPIRMRGEVRQLELTKKIQTPDAAHKPEDIPEALEKWDTDMREYFEAGGQAQSFDEKRSALLSILPDPIRKDVLMTVHMMDPGPNAPQHIQDDVYLRIRAAILKQVELITQYANLGKKSPVNNVDFPSDQCGNPEDHMPEPAADDAAGQALYAVYQKGLRYGKGKSKGKSGVEKGPSGKASGGR